MLQPAQTGRAEGQQRRSGFTLCFRVICVGLLLWATLGVWDALSQHAFLQRKKGARRHLGKCVIGLLFAVFSDYKPNPLKVKGCISFFFFFFFPAQRLLLPLVHQQSRLPVSSSPLRASFVCVSVLQWAGPLGRRMWLRRMLRGMTSRLPGRHPDLWGDTLTSSRAD